MTAALQNMRERTDSSGTEASSPATATSPRAQVGPFEVRFALGAAMAEVAIVLLSHLTGVPFAAALALHFAVISVLAFALYRRRRSEADLSAPLITLIATSTAGPVGAVLGLAALVWLARPAQPPALLESWYNRIAMSTTVDPETQLSDRVASGRVIATTAPPPQALAGVIREGSLVERQAALGLIARFFHMNYLSALADALRSEVPVIRVQAAAVASRIRPRLADEIEKRIAAAADLLRRDEQRQTPRSHATGHRLQLIREFDQAIASGLLDQPVADAAAVIAARLASSIDCARIALPGSGALDAHARLDAFEKHLIDNHDFKRLRLLRRRRLLAGSGLQHARIKAWPGDPLARLHRVPGTSAGVQ